MAPVPFGYLPSLLFPYRCFYTLTFLLRIPLFRALKRRQRTVGRRYSWLTAITAGSPSLGGPASALSFLAAVAAVAALGLTACRRHELLHADAEQTYGPGAPRPRRKASSPSIHLLAVVEQRPGLGRRLRKSASSASEELDCSNVGGAPPSNRSIARRDWDVQQFSSRRRTIVTPSTSRPITTSRPSSPRPAPQPPAPRRRTSKDV